MLEYEILLNYQKKKKDYLSFHFNIAISYLDIYYSYFNHKSSPTFIRFLFFFLYIFVIGNNHQNLLVFKMFIFY